MEQHARVFLRQGENQRVFAKTRTYSHLIETLAKNRVTGQKKPNPAALSKNDQVSKGFGKWEHTGAGRTKKLIELNPS